MSEDARPFGSESTAEAILGYARALGVPVAATDERVRSMRAFDVDSPTSISIEI